jgi:hypothetical protein
LEAFKGHCQDGMEACHNDGNPANNKLENFIRRSSDRIRASKREYIRIKEMINNTPLQIRIANIVVPFIFMYIFTIIYLNIPLSIIFSIITTFFIFLLSKLFCIIYIILYIIILSNCIRKSKSTLGIPILQTDIVKSGVPYNCLNKSLTIQYKENTPVFSYYVIKSILLFHFNKYKFSVDIVREDLSSPIFALKDTIVSPVCMNHSLV